LTIRRKIENGRYYCAFGCSKAHHRIRAPALNPLEKALRDRCPRRQLQDRARASGDHRASGEASALLRQGRQTLTQFVGVDALFPIVEQHFAIERLGVYIVRRSTLRGRISQRMLNVSQGLRDLEASDLTHLRLARRAGRLSPDRPPILA
jgi:hypothetical protein